MMKSIPPGFGDCEWFACDSFGQLAMFTSAGSEFIPEYFWERAGLLLDLTKTIKTIPSSCGFRLTFSPKVTERYESWTELAVRGIFGFDFDLNGQDSYKLLAIPDKPFQTDLDVTIPSAVLPRFNGNFAESSVIPAALVLKWLPS